MARTERWLGGPVEGVAPELQPVAHALLQAVDDARDVMNGFPEDRLWIRPGGAASCGFHLLHVSGSMDRLFTYARGEQLTDAQRQALSAEKSNSTNLGCAALLALLQTTVANALSHLRNTDPATLHDERPVGRAQLPSTVGGLLFHAAEHSARHMGQLTTTAKIITST